MKEFKDIVGSEKTRRRFLMNCHIEEKPEPIKVEGRLMFVNGWIRGHNPFYGSVYQYYRCTAIYIDGCIFAIKFKGGCPMEFIGYNILQDGLYCERPLSDGFKDSCFMNEFNECFCRVKYPLMKKASCEEKVRIAKRTYSSNPTKWKREIRELASREYDDYCNEIYNHHIHFDVEIPPAIKARMNKQYRDGNLKGAIRTMRFYQKYKNIGEGQTSCESSRQLRALGFVA